MKKQQQTDMNLKKLSYNKLKFTWGLQNGPQYGTNNNSR